MKNNAIQFMRGICILCVVLIHCTGGLYYEYQSFWQNYSIIIRQAINFAVAIFIFLSGYLTSLEKINKSYILKRLKRLVMPYLIWSFLYIALSLGPTSPKKIIHLLLTGASSAQLYYIVVLLQLTLLVPIIKLFHKNIFGRAIIILTSLIWYFAIYYTKFTLPNKMLLFPAWLLFYYLGIYAKDKNLKYLIKPKYLPILITLFLSAAEAFLLNSIFKNYNISVAQLQISNIVYSLAVANLVLHLINSEKHYFEIITKIGDYSYGIYYMHMLVIAVISKLLSIISQNINILLYQTVTVSITIFICFTAIKISNRFLPEKLNKIIGFK